jgi:DNA-binding LacI/PurR family transcriptional regulator
LRTTLKDIAAAAGVSVMTVSLVLRKQGKISEATRARVTELAHRLGYQPDPVLSALVHYRGERQTTNYRSTLAFLTSFPTRDEWKSREYISQYFAGACSRAGELGYRVAPFWMKEPGMSPQRLTEILHVRGIKGVLIAPIEEPSSKIELDWNRFCAVSLCRNLVQPKINTVDHNHRQSMEEAFDQLIARGYRRPGFISLSVPESMNGWVFTSTLAAIRKRRRRELDQPVPDLLMDDWDYPRLRRWYEKYRPDVLLSQFGYPYIWMLKEGIAVPDETGFLHLEASDSLSTTGICQHFTGVGVTAVDLVHLELLRDERGVPKIRQSIEIDGSWIEGRSLRALPPTMI